MAGTNSTDLDSNFAMSYNSTGWSKFKVNFVQTLLITHSIQVCAIQEHMLLKRNINRLSSVFPGYESFILPATKCNTNINQGRPSGGLALIYSKAISKHVSHIVCPGSNRVQAIKVSSTSETAVFINVYMPTDPRVNNFDDTILLQTLQDIKFILNQCQPHYKINVLGDLNTDFGRNTVFVDIVRDFMASNNLLSLWDMFECDFTFSQHQIRNGLSNCYYSTIDHFFVNDGFAQITSEASVLHLGENLSNHAPILVKYLCSNTVSILDDDTKLAPISKPAWNKVTTDQINSYRNKLTEALHNITIPEESLSCSNVKCSNEHHCTAIDSYSEDILAAINNSVSSTIPQTNSVHQTPVIPGWNDHVKPYQTEAKFWHAVWTSYGRPENTSIHAAMKYSRNQFHYAVRRAKNQEASIRKDKYLNQCINNNTTAIFRDLKKQRKTAERPNNMDGVTGSTNIANKFRHTYNKLYNVHEDQLDINSLLNEITENLDDSHVYEVRKITPALIKSMVNRMKSGKNDISFNFRSDALKFGIDQLAPHISVLFKAFLIHGHISAHLLKCALIPIPKETSGNLSSSDNYRAIAMSSLVMKLYDVTMLELVQPQQFVSKFQFGFMTNISSTFCTWTVSETINYFTNRGGQVYVCLLDLTKAFDMIKLSKLFNKLKDKVHPIHLRVLMYSYTKQQCTVRWGNHESETFNISNGVRQGAVSSPVLFSLYIDSLFQTLEDSGLGCHIDHLYFGVCAYADDIVLLSPTRSGLQQMLNIAHQFFTDHGIAISTNIDLRKSKTKCMAFGLQIEPVKISLNGVDLPWVSSYKHLGHLLHTSEDWSHDLLKKRGVFIGEFHELQQELGLQESVVMEKLVNTYITSFYGSSLWDLKSVAAEKLWSSWYTMLRTIHSSIHKLPFGTRRFIVNELSSIQHLRTMLYRRFIKFQDKLSKCDKPQVKHLEYIQRLDLRSTYGRNCRNINKDTLYEDYMSAPVGEMWRVELTRDILYSHIEGFSDTELDCLLQDICVDRH